MSTETHPPLTVTRELLEIVAALGGHEEAEPDPSQDGHRDGKGPGTGLDIRKILKEQGIDFREKTSPYGRVLQLDRCLTSTEHDDGACIIEFPSGALAYRCQHASCAGKGWLDARVTLKLGGNQRGTSHDPNGAKDPTVFQVLWDDEIEDLPAPAWLVNGYLLEKSISVLYGPPGIGKSFLTLDVALSVARGSDWHGHQMMQGIVVYGASEGAAGFGQRVKAWKQHYGLTGRRGAGFVFQPCNFLDSQDVNAFLGMLKALPESPRLVIIDTLAWAMAGGDEYAVKDVMLVLQAARRIRDEIGPAVLIVHHTGKNGEAERGSSALRAGADTMLKLSADGKLLKLTVDKQKDAATPRPKMLQLQRINVSGPTDLNDPDPVIDLTTSCVLVDADTAAESEDVLPNQLLTPNRRRALETLRDAADELTPTSRWERASGLKASSFDSVRNHLVSEGYVEVRSQGNSRLNRITPEGRTVLNPGLSSSASSSKESQR